MSEIPRCFQALGFDKMPENVMEVEERYNELLGRRRSGTESDRLARQLLRENYEMCIEAMDAAHDREGA